MNETTTTVVTEVAEAFSAEMIQAVKDVAGLSLKRCDTGLFYVLAVMTPEAEKVALSLYLDQAIKAANDLLDTQAFISIWPIGLESLKAYSEAAYKAERAYCYLVNFIDGRQWEINQIYKVRWVYFQGLSRKAFLALEREQERIEREGAEIK